MSDLPIRDRVTAIEAAIAKQLERDYYPVAPAIAKSVMRTPALLEALDTIDRLEGVIVRVADELEASDVIDVPLALGTYGVLTKEARRVRQPLNGGNEPIPGPPNPPRVPDHHPFA